MGAFVNGAGDELLAGAGFTGDEYGGVCGSDFCDTREDGLQCRRLSDDFLKHRGFVNFVAEGDIFFVKLVAESLDLVEGGFKGDASFALLGDVHGRAD